MKRCKPLILMLTVAIVLTGCWDRKEINDLGLLLLTALDEGEEPGTYQAYLQIAIPKKMGVGQTSGNGGKGQKPYMPLLIKAKKVDELRIELDRQLSRDLITTHRRIYIIGESLAKRGVKGILDEISRNPKNRLRTLFVVAKGMQAKTLAESEYPLEQTNEEVMREMIARKMQIPSTLRDFFAASAAPGIEPIMAAYSKDKNGKFAVDSIAILRGYKLVGYVERNQAMALTSLLGEEPFGIILLRLPDIKGSISVQLDKLQVKRKLQIVDGQPAFTCKVSASGRIMENETNIDLANADYINKLNKVLEEEITKLYQSLFLKLQKKYRADSAGLGATIYQKDTKFWKKTEKDWPKMYMEQKIEFEVKAKITHIGVVGAPFYLPEDEVKE